MINQVTPVTELFLHTFVPSSFIYLNLELCQKMAEDELSAYSASSHGTS
jgi:hypothetical protein